MFKMFNEFLVVIIFAVNFAAEMAIHILSKYRIITKEEYYQLLLKEDLEDDRNGTDNDEYTRSEIRSVDTREAAVGPESPMAVTTENGIGAETPIVPASLDRAEVADIQPEQTNNVVIENTPSTRIPTAVVPNRRLPKPMKAFPCQPRNYHPVLLLNQIHPGLKYNAIIVGSEPLVFNVHFMMHGVTFEGHGLTKKAAKTEACIAAINFFYNFNYHSM